MVPMENKNPENETSWFDTEDSESFDLDSLPETPQPKYNKTPKEASSFDELPAPKYSLGLTSEQSDMEPVTSKPKYANNRKTKQYIKPVRDFDETPATPEEVKNFNKQAENFIVWHLSQRDLTTHEAHQKLVKKQKWPQETINYVIKKCLEHRWLDDEKYVENFIRSEQKWNKLGKYAIKMKLIKKGVSTDIIETFLQAINNDDETLAAKELLIKQVDKISHLPDDKKTQRLLGLLARKGYPASVAYPLVKEIVGNPDIILDEWI
jgi:regulatory protein